MSINNDFQYKTISSRQEIENPFFSILIPHYRYPDHFRKGLESVLSQNFKDFEVIVSDDCSPCNSHKQVDLLFLSSDCDYSYIRHDSNQGYDRNVRFLISKARGKYVFLLGNDDALNDESTLEQLLESLTNLQFPQVAFTSYSDYHTGKYFNRARETKVIGSGYQVAAKIFRAFSFVSGLIFDRALAQKHVTSTWDSSVYYQFYLATKIICEGFEVASISIDAVRHNITVDGAVVATARKVVDTNYGFGLQYNGTISVLRVVLNTIRSYVPSGKESKVFTKIFIQVLLVSYPVTVINYRTRRNWQYAFGVVRRMSPSYTLPEYILPIPDDIHALFSVTFSDLLKVKSAYYLSSVLSLTIPLVVFRRVSPFLSRFVRKIQQ